MCLQVRKLGRAFTICTWAQCFSAFQCDTFALSHILEFMVANILTLDFEAVSVLPGVSDLQIADPIISIQGTLLLIGVQLVNVTPTSPVVLLGLNALMRQVIEIRGETCFQNVTIDTDDIAVQESHEVLTTNIEDTVSRVIMLVHLHAASAEQLRDIIITEESRAYFEAATATESPIDIILADDCVTDDMMVGTQHSFSDLLKRHHSTWANLGIVDLNAVSKEQLVHLFDLCASTKDALIAPVVLKIVATNPLACFLLQVSQGCLETMSVRQCIFHLISSNKSIPK